MQQASIQCDGCKNWIDQECMNMTLSQYFEFGRHVHYQFFCLDCLHDESSRFKYLASLRRIAAFSADIQHMRQQAESERNLLLFYNVTLPPLSCPNSNEVSVHQVSTSVLRYNSQSSGLLNQFVPATV